MTPAEDMLRFDGNEPEPSDHVYGAVPPVAVNCATYPALTVPVGTLVVEIVRGAASAVAVQAMTRAIANSNRTNTVWFLIIFFITAANPPTLWQVP
jgi:hypothetical protein